MIALWRSFSESRPLPGARTRLSLMEKLAQRRISRPVSMVTICFRGVNCPNSVCDMCKFVKLGIMKCYYNACFSSLIA